MLGVYLMSLLFGGILVAAGVLLGDADKDLDHDVDHDVDADQDGPGEALADAAHGLKLVDADTWLPFFTLRFWTFGTAAFGATGLLLTLFQVPDLVGAPVSGVTGAVVGTVASWIFRQLKRDTVSGSTRLDRYVGEQAVVLLPIRPDRVGQIRLETAAGDIVVPARTRDGHEIPVDSKVLVAAFDGRTADVTRIFDMPSAPVDEPDARG